MSSVSSIAASGMAAATMQLQASANNVANAASNPDADLGSEIVQQLMARVTFAANAQVMKTDAQMTKAFVDILA